MPITIYKDGATAIRGPEGIKLYRMLNILMGLKLELRGMRLTRKAPSCFSIARREFGLKGSKQKILADFQKLCDEQDIKVTRVYEARSEEDPSDEDRWTDFGGSEE